ncbi:MAG: hypothetical protein K1X75_09215 [Leptospirales bacterium]|nr:hypothetical protein [Leptospirales bacterium]
MNAAESALLDFLRRLENPEQSRRFSPQQWQSRMRRLQEMAGSSTLRLQGERIAVVGSNGKGSTSFLLAGLANVAGAIGLYTSPHLSHPLERIRLNLQPVAADSAWRSLEILKAQFEDFEQCSYFEALTLLAVHLFSSAPCELCVFEAGLGGRLDATRIAAAQTVVLTRVVLEHGAILGDSLVQIAREKLAIAGPDTMTIALMSSPGIADEQLLALARQAAPQARCLLWPENPANSGASYIAENERFVRWLLGELSWSTRLLRPELPGRLELHSESAGARSCRFFFDVAHNRPALERCLPDLIAMGMKPGDDTLVVLMALADRSIDALQTPLEQAGFRRLLVLQGRGLALAPAALRGVDAESLTASLRASYRQRPFDSLAFLGSHRLYDYYLKCRQTFAEIAGKELET